jgi:hypothetical protein
MRSYKIALPPEVTSTVRVVDGKADSAHARRIELFLCQTLPPGELPQLQIALGVVDLPPKSTAPPPDQSAQPAPAPAPSASEPIHELVVLQPMELRAPAAAMILVPFTFKDGTAKSVILSLHATMGATGDEMAKALATCTDDLKASAAALSKASVAPAAGTAAWPGFEAALNGIRTPASRRPSLVYLATQANADICEDAALSANDQTLEQLSTAILKQASEGALPREPTSLGWALDGATLKFISQLQSSGTKAPPELLAVLLRHTGQVGDNSGSVDDLIKVSGSKKDFDLRVTAENMVYLEDNSPAARVRAFDWLSARGAAPAGYDPLGSPRERHDALQRAIDSAAAKVAGGRP